VFQWNNKPTCFRLWFFPRFQKLAADGAFGPSRNSFRRRFDDFINRCAGRAGDAQVKSDILVEVFYTRVGRVELKSRRWNGGFFVALALARSGSGTGCVKTPPMLSFPYWFGAGFDGGLRGGARSRADDVADRMR